MNLNEISPELHLVEFMPQEASEELWSAYFTLSESIFMEFNPNARLPVRAAARRLLSTPSPLYTVRRTMALDEMNKPVAFMSIGYDTELSPSYQRDRHVCQIKVQVDKFYRRRSIGSRLLLHLLDTARRMGKETVQTDVENPIGKKFCQSMKGELVHKEVQHRMYLEEADNELAAQWLAKGRERFPDTRFELFENCPEDVIEAFCQTYTRIINERPTGGMDQTIITTPESRRIEEQNMKQRGIAWYTLISREKNGDISGMTDIMYNPREPHKVVQYFTGVSAQHRRKGLAKRLKAEMLGVIKRQFPDVEYITTSMAETNRAMQAINAQLGFKSRKTCHVYQWDLPDLKKRVEDHLMNSGKKRKTDGQKDFLL
jgi:GNAT superfamily N-acetyltransferase